ncbi:MAG TPA: HD domain-containing phosphohydrolase [Candidatus Limnocylindrales bacterium]|nr:HD domain-containing phosphohydrolase [Candidatus Limnocylindrales bacterium]
MEPFLARPASSATNLARRVPGSTVWLFVAGIVVAAAALLAVPPLWHEPIGVWLSAFIVLTILSTALEFAAVALPHDGALSVATITHLATIILVPPPFAAVSVALAILVEELVNRRPLVKIAFNVASYALTLSISSLAIGLVGDPWDSARSDHFRLAVIMLVAVLTYQLSNKLLTAAIISIATGRGFLYLLRANGRNTGLTELGAGTLGSLFALIWTVHPAWTLLLVVPTAVITRTLRYVRQLEGETRSAVRSLATVIDHRDPYTAYHSERVARYAVTLAQRMGLDEDLVELIDQAASVHDLGKIGVADSVLLKPGPLSERERASMWLHTEIGARILEHFELFRKGSGIVLHHHERWDGAGYPGGLAGERIPLGARVVAVADAFDAMTTDRPYRSALPLDEATRRLKAGAGTQWDPACVAAFVELIGQGRIQPARPDVDAVHPSVAHATADSNGRLTA